MVHESLVAPQQIDEKPPRRIREPRDDDSARGTHLELRDTEQECKLERRKDDGIREQEPLEASFGADMDTRTHRAWEYSRKHLRRLNDPMLFHWW